MLSRLLRSSAGVFGLLVLVLVAVPAGRMTAAEANLIVNGDFEQPARGVPPGWAMWGDEKYKVPANFSRDTGRPHGGQASLRIHHPAGSRGYIVSAPQTPVRTRPGMTYTVTFWARGDRPGQALFQWTAYRSIAPFAEAPSPRAAPLTVDGQWREFRFAIDEGWDFFADEARLLLLTFKATPHAKEERTLWIDDVVVTEQPSRREGRLLNPAALACPPLDHHLRPGEQLAVTVDADRHAGPVVREVGGVSFHRVAGWVGLPYDRQGRYVLSAEMEEAIRQLRLPMTRFYGLGAERFGLEAALDKAAQFCRRIGVPAEAVPLEFEPQDASVTLAPEVWARGVQQSLAAGHGFRHWEVTNEPYVDEARGTFPTADSYLQHFLAVSRALRAAHPAGRIGLEIEHRSPDWGNYLLKQAAGHYDFVVPHYYWFANPYRTSFEDVVLTSNYLVLAEINKVNALMRAYNPGRDVCQYDTEWGLLGHGPHGEQPEKLVRNANIFGMMHRAVRLIHYLRESPLRGASSWEMFTVGSDPGCGFFLVDAPHRRSMNYWLYYYFNRHVGRWVVSLEGTAPYYKGTYQGQTVDGPLTPMVATLDEDGRRLAIIAANGSWSKAVRCRIDVRHFAVGRAQAVALSHDDPDASPFLEHKEELVHDLPVAVEGSTLQCTLPPHAVVFISVLR